MIKKTAKPANNETKNPIITTIRRISYFLCVFIPCPIRKVVKGKILSFNTCRIAPKINGEKRAINEINNKITTTNWIIRSCDIALYFAIQSKPDATNEIYLSLFITGPMNQPNNGLVGQPS